MGIGRHRPLERLLGSETTLRAIRRASCPVLAVGPQFAAQLRNVVVAIDFSPASAKAVESVIPLPVQRIHAPPRARVAAD